MEAIINNKGTVNLNYQWVKIASLQAVANGHTPQTDSQRHIHIHTMNNVISKALQCWIPWQNKTVIF